MPHLTLLPTASSPAAPKPPGMSFDVVETPEVVFDKGALAELEQRLEAVRRRREFRLIQGGGLRCVHDAREDAAR